MNFFDEVLNNTGANIVDEQHDVNQIDGVAALWDPNELGAAGRARGEQALRDAAINRASLDVSNGRVSVMVAQERPWHKLGVFVREAVDSRHARKLANLDWLVVKMPMHYDFGGMRQSATTFALVRNDTGDQLGVCGTNYVPQQNAQGFDFLDEVLAEFGAKYETAGAIYGGQQVWMQARLPSSSFKVQQGDTIDAFATFTLDHTGSSANRCFATSDRIVCANTFRIATGNTKGIRITHVPNPKRQIDEAKEALGLTVRSFNQFREVASLMVLRDTDPKAFFNAVLDETVPVDPNADPDAQKRALVKRASILDEILDRYESDRCQPAGSTWAAFNAVTEYADHTRQRRFRERDRESRRFDYILTGDGDEMKQVAYELVLEQLRA